MALKKYRRQVIRVRDANDELPEVILSTGDEAGRIIQLVITGGENYGTHCRFWLQKEEGLNVYQDMEQVTASYPTWEAAINTGGIEPGVYPCMFRIGDNDGSVTETFKTTARVLQGMLIDAEESEEMQSQLSEFEQRTEDAIAANETATAAANDAAEAATAATEAIEHALDEVDVRVLTSGLLSVTNVDGVQTSYDVKQQVSDAINPKIEDADAATQAANDAASAANSAATSATDAATAATSATSAATQATTSANSAASSATSAASDASAAATSANSAASSATSAAAAANTAAEQVAPTITEVQNIRVGFNNETYSSAGDAVRSQINAINSGNGYSALAITYYGYYINCTGDTIDISSKVYSPTWNSIIADCESGDQFTLNATGGSDPRAYAFIDSNGTVLEKSGSSKSFTNAVITAPNNAAKLIINDNSGRISFDGVSTKKSFDLINSSLDLANNNINHIINNMVLYDLDINDFEVGNITFSVNGPTYEANNFRVRTKEGHTIKLNAGDIVTLQDYSVAKIYLSVQIKNSQQNSYVSMGWLESDYAVPYGGNYMIVLMEQNPTFQRSPEYLFNMLKIYKNYSIGIDAIKNKTIIHAINHRGFSRTAPENTAPAFKLSKWYGFEYVECDVNFTSDNVPVLIHDYELNRTARNADGTELSSTIMINDITYEQALTYDFGIWKSVDYAGTKILSFDDFVGLCKKLGIKPYVEIKGAGLSQSNVWNLVDIAKSYQMQNEIVWVSFYANVLSYILERDQFARIGYVVNNITTDVITTVQGLSTNDNDIFIDSGSYTDAEITLCKNAGIPLEVWTLNTDTAILSLDKYITGVTSDAYNANSLLYERIMSDVII